MEIEQIKITDIVPADYNPRLISEDEALKLRNSLDKFGMVDPIIVNLKNNHIIGGHQRYDVLVNKYMEDGFSEDTKLNLIRLGSIGWVFTDTDLEVADDSHEKALNLALNKISGDWDYGKLQNVLDDLELDGFDVDLTGFDSLDVDELNNLSLDDDEELSGEGNNKYNNNIKVPQYEITGESPELTELIDTDKQEELLARVKSLNVPKDVKYFLELSTYRHLRFDYGKIAEFYAHQDADVQEVMEASALVLIDFDDAVANGYVELSKTLKEIFGGEIENE